MAVEFALFLSPDGIGLAHRQPSGHWALIGETSLEVDDLGARLAHLRMLGEARGGEDFPALLVLPDDQILYTELPVDVSAGDIRAQVGRGLDGRTPYALGELAFDFRPASPGNVQVAAVAQQTLTEAIDFARSAGFNGVGFAATPAEARYPGVPIFELASGFSIADTPSDGIPFGPDTWADGALDVAPLDAEVAEEPAQVFVTEAAAEPPVDDHATDAADETLVEDADDTAEISDETAETDAPDAENAEAEPAADLAPEDDPAPEADPDDTPEAETPEDAALDAEDTAEPLDEALDTAQDGDEPSTPDEDATDPDEAEDLATADALTDEAEVEPAEEAEPQIETDRLEPSDTDEDFASDPTPEPAPLPWADAPEDTTEELTAADDAETTDTPDQETDPETTPATDPSYTPASDMGDDRAAAFLTYPSDDDEGPQTAEPQFSTHRPLTAAPVLPESDGVKRRLQLDVGLDGGVDAAPDDDIPAAAPEPQPRASRPRRKARTPALFAGGGHPQESWKDARVEPALEPSDARPDLPDTVTPELEPEPTAEAPKDPPEIPSMMPAGLLDRLGQRRGRPRDGGDAAPAAPLIAARNPTNESLVGADINDQLMAGGVLGQRVETAARPSLRTALVLTIVLVLILALIAVWSALFLPDSRVAQLFGRVAPEIEVTTPVDETPELAPEPEITTALVVPDAALPDDDPQPEPAATDPLPTPTPPPLPARVPPPTLEEARAEYAQYGIWQLAPDPPAAPARDFVIPEATDNIELAALAPVTLGHDAVALTEPSRPVNPTGQPSPPPFGAALNRQGLIAATPEGVVTPDGAFVILAQPQVATRPRPGPVPDAIAGDSGSDAGAPAQTAAGGLGDAILAAFPPTPRPDTLEEPTATEALTDQDLAARQPTPRPQSLQEEAEAAREAAEAEAETEGDGSALAVASSIVPQTRPASIASAAEEARGPAGAASTASLTAPTVPQEAPPTVVPDIPSSASVSRTATVENVIDLREINLIGVRGAPDNRVALVRLASGRFVTVSVGDRLDGGRVAAIGTDSLQYVRNGRNITLEAPEG